MYVKLLCLIPFYLTTLPVASSSKAPSPSTSPSRASSLPRSRSSSPPIKLKGKEKIPNLASTSRAHATSKVNVPSDDEGEDEVPAEEYEEDEVESSLKDRAVNTKTRVAPSHRCSFQIKFVMIVLRPLYRRERMLTSQAGGKWDNRKSSLCRKSQGFYNSD